MFANKIEYFYDATGIKQKKKVTEGTVITTTDYRAERLENSRWLFLAKEPAGARYIFEL